MRDDKPFIFTNLMINENIENIMSFIKEMGMFN